MSLFEKHKPWSYSKLSELKKCPYLFFSSRIERVRPSKNDGISNINALSGTIIHNFLDDFFKGKTALEDFYGYVESHDVPEYVLDSALSKIDQVTKIIKKVFKLIDQTLGKGTRFHSEYKIFLDDALKKYEGTTPTFMAIFDLIAFNDDTILLIDHKSKVRQTKDFKEQMLFYNIMAAHTFPKAKVIHTYLADLNKGDLLDVSTWSTEDIKTRMSVDFGKDLVSQFKPFNRLVKENFRPKPSKFCKWCYLLDTCPAKKD